MVLLPNDPAISPALQFWAKTIAGGASVQMSLCFCMCAYNQDPEDSKRLFLVCFLNKSEI